MLHSEEDHVSDVGDLEWEIVARCPVCQASRHRRWREHARDGSQTVSHALRYLACRRCDARFLSPRPTAATVGGLYDTSYPPYVQVPSSDLYLTGSASPPAGTPTAAASVLRALHRLYGERRGARILDFGCGSPAFLDAAARQGWVGMGVDLDLHVVESVRDSGHRAVLLDDAFWRELKPASFEAIRLSHVIEHVDDPNSDVRRLVSALTEGGTFHIVTPNPESVTATLFRRNWFSYDPRHLTLFPPRTMTRMLREAGLGSVRILHEFVTKDLVRSIQLATRQDGMTSIPWSLPNRLLGGFGVASARIHRADRYHAIATQ